MSTTKGEVRKTSRRAYEGLPDKRVRTRRVYVERVRRVKHTKKVGLFSLIGVGLGSGLSAFSNNGASLDPEAWKGNTAVQVQNVANGLLAGVSGYDYDKKEWKASNLLDFWAPTIGFAVVDKIAGKFGFDKVHIYKNINLAGKK